MVEIRKKEKHDAFRIHYIATGPVRTADSCPPAPTGKNMKVAMRRHIQVGEVTPDRLLRLDAMVNILQEAAIEHSRQVGIELNSLLDSGKTWVLGRIGIELDRLPALNEEVEVQTWSRSIQRFKGLREFTFSVAGERIASASTLWLYLDVARRRPVRVPDHYETIYGSIPERATAGDIEQWTPPEKVSADSLQTITTRISDFDVNGHVNNAVVLQYIQTAKARMTGETRKIRAVRLGFLREIPDTVRELQVAAEEEGNQCLFQLRQNETVFVSGCIETASGPNDFP